MKIFRLIIFLCLKFFHLLINSFAANLDIISDFIFLIYFQYFLKIISLAYDVTIL